MTSVPNGSIAIGLAGSLVGLWDGFKGNLAASIPINIIPKLKKKKKKL